MNSNAVKTDLGKAPVGKLLLKLTLPAVAAQLINMLYNLVDRMYVGSIPNSGTDALAGLGVCFPVILIVSAFAALAGAGGAPLAAIKLGEKRRDDAERILNGGLLLLLLLSVVLTVVITVFSEPILMAFGSPESSLPYADSYLKIYGAGTVFVLLALGLNSYISAQGFAFVSMATVFIGAALNIALDPVFIFVLNMGVKGAALATVISQAASAFFAVSFFFTKKTFIKINFKYIKLDKNIILPMLALGITPFIMQATESAVQIVFNIQIKHYTGGNNTYTAALTIIMSVMQMIALPLNGIGVGAQPLISYNYGAGLSDRVKKTVKYLFASSFVVCFSVWILCLTAPSIFASVFSAAPEVTLVVKSYMPIFMMGTIFFCAQFSLQNAFLALGQAKISMFLAFLRKVFLLIPLAFIFPLFMGVKGVFLAEGIADIIAGTITLTTFIFMFGKILKKRELYLKNVFDNAQESETANDNGDFECNDSNKETDDSEVNND